MLSHIFLLFFFTLKGFCFNFGNKTFFIVTNSEGKDYDCVDVLIYFDTSSYIKNGLMKSNCDDIQFLETKSGKVIQYFLEGGCETEKTYVWLNFTNFVDGESRNITMLFNSQDSFSDNDERKRVGNTNYLHLVLYSSSSIPFGYNRILMNDTNSLEHSDNVLFYKILFDDDPKVNIVGEHSHSFNSFQWPQSSSSTYQVAQGSSSSGCDFTTTDHYHLEQGITDGCYIRLNYKLLMITLESAKNYFYLPSGSFVLSTIGGTKDYHDQFTTISSYLCDYRGSSTSYIGNYIIQTSLKHSHSLTNLNISEAIGEKSYCVPGSYSIPIAKHKHSFFFLTSLPDFYVEPAFTSFYMYKTNTNGWNPFYGMIAFGNKLQTKNILGWEPLLSANNTYIKFDKDFGYSSGGSPTHNHIFNYTTFSTKPDNTISASLGSYKSSVIANHLHGEENGAIASDYSPTETNHINLRAFVRKDSPFLFYNGAPSCSKNCHNRGKCVSLNYCECNSEKFIGPQCDVEISQGEYISPKVISIPYIALISEIPDELTETISCTDFLQYSAEYYNDTKWSLMNCSFVVKGSGITTTDALQIILYSSDLKFPFLILSTVGNFESKKGSAKVIIKLWTNNSTDPKTSPDYTPYITAAVIVGVLVGAFLILLISIAFVLVMRLLIQTCKIKKIEKIKDIELLLNEKEAELGKTETEGKENTLPELEIDKSLFEIDYNDLVIEKKLGKGGSDSFIFLCNWKEKKVAFKCFQTNDLFNTKNDFGVFEKEIKVLSSISHPNILRFYGCTLNPPRVGFIMEYCENGDLSGFLQKYFSTSGKKYPNNQKYRMMVEMVSAYTHLHSIGIIHRDVKLENVFVTGTEDTRIADFGISRVDKNSHGEKTRTARVGTSFYMAPEVLNGKYSDKVDVFSFSILLFMLITENYRPYGVQTTFNIEVKVFSDPTYRPVIKEEEFKDFEWIIPYLRTGWHADPDQRWSFSQLSVILKQNGKIFEKENQEAKIEKRRSRIPVPITYEELDKEIEDLKKEGKRLKSEYEELLKTGPLIEKITN